MDYENPFTEEDIPFLKLFKIVRDVGSKTLIDILKDLYQEHPYSKKGTISAKEFCNELQRQAPKNKNLFGRDSKAKIKELLDDYKFDNKDNSPSKLDISTLFAIIDEMCVIRNSSATLKNKKELLEKNSSNRKEIEKHNIHIAGAENLEEYGNRYEKIFMEIKVIKNIRNELCHGNSFNIESLNCSKKSFENSLRTLCLEMAILFPGKLYNHILEQGLKVVNSIWNADFTINMAAERLLIENDEVYQFIRNCKIELKNKYKDFSVLLPSFLVEAEFMEFDINDIFVPVSLYTKKTLLDYNNILTYNSEKKSNSPPAVVISGNAGLGKTTICRKLTSDWCQKDLSRAENACNYDLLLHIEAKKAKQKSLVDYLKNVLLPATQRKYNYDKDDIISYLAQCNILFIIDGYDEKSEDASKLLDEIMTYFPNKKFLISTRPYYTKEIFNSLQQKNLLYLDVNIHGFLKENRKQFIENIWDKMKKSNVKCGKADSFSNFLEKEIGRNLGELLSIPLAILIIIYLYLSGKQDFKSIKYITFTDLYRNVFHLIKNSLVNKFREHYCNIENCVDNVIVVIAAECFRITLEKRSSVDKILVKNIRSKVKEFESASPELATIIFTSFFLFNPSLQRQNVKMPDAQLADHLEFLHKTQLEYLTAYYIVNEISNAKFLDTTLLEKLFEINSLKSDENIETVFGIASFMMGLLTDYNHSNKNVFIIKLMNYLLTLLKNYKKKLVVCWNILYETKKFDEVHNLEFDSIVSNEFLKILPASKWELHNYEVVSGLKLLSYSNIKIQQLTLNINEGICTYEIPQLLYTFGDIRHCMSLLYNKYKPLLLELHFHGDLRKGTEPNDDILRSLYPWGHLEKFTGFLGDGAYEPLKYCYKLSFLHVRFKTIKALHLCTEALHDKFHLKTFHLYICNNQEDNDDDDYRPLNICRQTKIIISFDGAFKENLRWIAQTLKKLKPCGQLFHTVTLLRTNLELSDINELLSVINTHVHKKFTVQSTNDISEEENLKINNSLHCKFDWLS